MSQKQNNQEYSTEDFIKDEIKDIKEKFGVEVSVIVESGKYRIISELALKLGRGDFYLTRPIDTIEQVANTLTGMYSILFVKERL